MEVYPGYKTQIATDVYPIPKSGWCYKFQVLKDKKGIASVDKDGFLTVSEKAKPGDKFTIKVSIWSSEPFPYTPSIVEYLVVSKDHPSC